MFDVAIVGAGVVGTCVARELSRYKLKIIVLEKNDDVAEGSSKANSGVVHGGYDAKPGTLKAKYNVLGQRMFDQLAAELDFTFRRNGSLVIADEVGAAKLDILKAQGIANGLTGLRIVCGEELRRLEPNLNESICAALVDESLQARCCAGGNRVSGIFACGNVLHVHDLVDFVSEESERAGASAAEYVRGKRKPAKQRVPITAKNGVRYTVPATVAPENLSGKIDIRFRVSGVFKNQYISIYSPLQKNCNIRLDEFH